MVTMWWGVTLAVAFYAGVTTGIVAVALMRRPSGPISETCEPCRHSMWQLNHGHLLCRSCHEEILEVEIGVSSSPSTPTGLWAR